MPAPRLLAVLLCLVVALAFARAAYPSSFSCAVSTYTLKAGDAPYEVCSINTTGGYFNNYLSMQWFTGTFDKPYGSESVLISM